MLSIWIRPSQVVVVATTDDLDLHVLPPEGDELNWSNVEDDVSGGIFQHDDNPGEPDWLASKTFQETVSFPLDGSALEGKYEFYIENNHEVDDPARPYTIYIYRGDNKVLTKHGKLANGAKSETYTYEYTL